MRFRPNENWFDKCRSCGIVLVEKGVLMFELGGFELGRVRGVVSNNFT